MKKIIIIIIIITILIVIAVAFPVAMQPETDNYKLSYRFRKAGTVYGEYAGFDYGGVLVRTDDGDLYCFVLGEGLSTENIEIGDNVEVQYGIYAPNVYGDEPTPEVDYYAVRLEPVKP